MAVAVATKLLYLEMIFIKALRWSGLFLVKKRMIYLQSPSAD